MAGMTRLICLLTGWGLLLVLAATAAASHLWQMPRIVHNADWTPQFTTINGVEMAYVPAGCFWMGSDNLRREEAPRHAQCVDAFYIARYEVTNADYHACVTARACTPPSGRVIDDRAAAADLPVVYVDWHQASAYAAWKGMRLLTEAEWEYAARGPDGLRFPWGDNLEDAPALANNMSSPLPVGGRELGASWVGAEDLSGNVWEWTSSLMQPYPYDPTDGREAASAAGERVLRGGAYSTGNTGIQSLTRGYNEVGSTYNYNGFRIGRSAE